MPQAETAKAPRMIAISSGKGGVGKSTVTANIAVAMADAGLSVGVVDADIYGPSIPRMLGIPAVKPAMAPDQRVIPAEAQGVKVISMAMLTDDDAPAILRGPMVHQVPADVRPSGGLGRPRRAVAGSAAGHGRHPADAGAGLLAVRCRGGQHAAGCQPQDRAARPSHDGAGQRAHSRRHREHERVSPVPPAAPSPTSSTRAAARPSRGTWASRFSARCRSTRTWSIAATRDGRSWARCARQPRRGGLSRDRRDAGRTGRG